MSANMKLWNAVEKTDPKATKHAISQRGGFTAIDAYYQIKAATEMFGPVGQGWGWNVVDHVILANDTVVVHIRLWHGDPKSCAFDVYGQKKLNSKNGPDEDAFKKALTDAITKGLSYLGFNADVFLGKFDDNKYVEQRRQEEEAKSEGLDPAMIFTQLEADIQAGTDMKSVQDRVLRYRALLMGSDKERFLELGRMFEKAKAKVDVSLTPGKEE